VLTLIMVSIIQKLSPYFSLAKWLLCSTGLIRYLHPTDDELKTLAGVPKDKSSKSRSRNGPGRIEYVRPTTFHVNRSIDVQLETAKITQYDVIHLRYFTEYQWLVDFSLYSIVVYTISEVGPMGNGCNKAKNKMFSFNFTGLSLFCAASR
jgi:hypothetical protein